MLLYSKPDCHLCEEMKIIVLKIRKENNFNFQVININEDKLLYEKYREKIPVLELNGRIIAKFRIDENKLKNCLLRN
ncbi:MAG TPA: glutaredoxin family protein [Ignavibacteria bacterium]|nr:glutaredoxin family protein [Ignavibacteria bacterium]